MKAMALALCATMLCFNAMADGSAGIQVTGRGTTEVEPDMARFTFEIVRQGNDAVALKREVDAATARVVALAEKHGVAKASITAAAVQVRPEYRYSDGRSILEGVHVSRTVRIELEDLTHYGAITNGVIAAGVNQIQGVELDVKDRSALERAALQAAVDRALDEARFIAGRLGMSVGRAIEVSVIDSGGPVVPYPARMAMSKEADNFRPGTLSVERAVAVRFELISQAPAAAPES